MEIYNELKTPASIEFKKLLNAQISNTKVEEGKITDGKIAKITEKFCFIEILGLKQEAVLDINEVRSIKAYENIKVEDKISVLVERTEDKNGEVIVSVIKAEKIKGYEILKRCYENKETVIGKIQSRVKGGFIVSHVDTQTLMFLPGSQLDVRPLRDTAHLMNIPLEFGLIKIDAARGNICCSRREVLSSKNKQSKTKIVSKFKVGDIINDAVVKGYSSFGCFFDVNNGELDVLVHLQEISYSRVNHPDEIFNIGEKHKLKVISVDESKLQVGCSIKQLSPDPFNHISNYEIGKEYDLKVVKLTQYGLFAELEPGLSTLLHSSEMSWTMKNVLPNKLFKVGQIIKCVITEIDKEKRRVAISHRLTKENPYEVLEKTWPVGSVANGIISSVIEYAIYIKLNGFEINGFCHANDISHTGNPEEQLKKYKKDDKIKVKILECDVNKQKVRVGIKQLLADPYDFFANKKVNDIVTVKVISSDTKGLLVKPEGSQLEFLIKKSQIAHHLADARPSRFVGNERLDAAISELDLKRKKVTLSIKLLEEIERKKALEKYGAPEGSGKHLPFSSLSDDLENKKKKDKE